MGGLGINYKNKVVTVKDTDKSVSDLTPSVLKIAPMKAIQTPKNNLLLKLGRMGHVAQYN